MSCKSFLGLTINM